MHIRTCFSHFQGRPSHFAKIAATELNGQIKILNVFRTGLIALELASLAYPEKLPMKRELKEIKDGLRITKVILHIFKAPAAVFSIYRRGQKISHLADVIMEKNAAGETPSKLEILKLGVEGAGLVKQTLSFTNEVIFKPLLLINEYQSIDHNGILKKCTRSISIAKSSAKIGYISGSLFLGTKRPVHKSIDLVIEIWELCFSSIRMAGIKIHPAANLALSVCKSIFGIYEIWLKTA